MEKLNELLGYERERPWILDDTIVAPICLDCYRPDYGLPVKPITRAALEAKLQLLREQGVTNFGGADLCWTCGKNLLTGKRSIPRKGSVTV